MLDMIDTTFSDMRRNHRSVEENMRLAIFQNRVNALRDLLKAKVNVNMRLQPYGHTPLTFAVRRGHTKMVAMLLEHGAHISEETLIYATRIKDHKISVDIMKMLNKAQKTRRKNHA
jgi:ankyrin repeat protein